MTEKRKTNLTKAERMKADMAHVYLLANGWRRIEPQERDYPGHSEELRKRVDALAAAHCGRGKFDPNHKGVRAQGRWAKAYRRCLMMAASPEWWKKNHPAQWEIIDPPTLPPSGELEGLSWDRGFLAYEKRPEAIYVDEDPRRPSAIKPHPPLRASEIVAHPHLWEPDLSYPWHPNIVPA